MRKLILIVFVVFGSLELNAQAPAQVVNDPITSALLGVSNTTLTTMEVLSKKVQKGLENAEWAKNLASMKQLYALIQSTTCTHQNLANLMAVTGGNKDCLISFQYNMQMQNLNAALDMISIIITTGMAMSSGDRLKVMNDAMANFRKAHTEMANLKSALEGRQLKVNQNKIQTDESIKLYAVKTKL